MNRLMRILGAAVVGIATFAASNPMADAGRIGGAISTAATVPPYQSVYFDVPFAAGESALVSSMGNGSTNLDLFLHDSAGNVAVGTGFADRKTASMYVHRAGFFRIEVRNLGPVANSFVLSTN